MRKFTTLVTGLVLLATFSGAGNATTLEDNNDVIDLAASLIVYEGYCAKLPPEVKAMAEKITLLEPEQVIAAGFRKKREHEQLGNILWCAHWRGVIQRSTR